MVEPLEVVARSFPDITDITFLRSCTETSAQNDLNLPEFWRRLSKSLAQCSLSVSYRDLPATLENLAKALHSKVIQIACHGKKQKRRGPSRKVNSEFEFHIENKEGEAAIAN